MTTTDSLVNYLRSLRKNAGLSQEDLAGILGYGDDGTVSKHELFQSIPSLLMALGYEIVFQHSVSEIFPGLRTAVETAIEANLAEFETKLLSTQDKNRRSISRPRTIAWLEERRAKKT